MTTEPSRDDAIARLLTRRTPPPPRPGFWAELTEQIGDIPMSDNTTIERDHTRAGSPTFTLTPGPARHDRPYTVLAVAAAALIIVGGLAAIRFTNDAAPAPATLPPNTSVTPVPTTSAPTTAPTTPPANPAVTSNLAEWTGEYAWSETTPAGEQAAQVLVHTMLLDTVSDSGLALGRFTSVGQTTNTDVAVQAELTDTGLRVSLIPGTDPGPYPDGAALFSLSGDPARPITTLDGLATLQLDPSPTGTYFVRVRSIDAGTPGSTATSPSPDLTRWIGTYTALEGGAGADQGRRPVAEYTLTLTRTTLDGQLLEGTLQRTAYEIVDETERVDDTAASFDIGITARLTTDGIEILAGGSLEGPSPYEEGLTLFTLTTTPETPQATPGALIPYITWDLITFAPA